MIGVVGRLWRIVAKRVAHDWLVLTGAVITVVMATTLLAAGPIYADAVTLSSLQRTVSDAAAEQANIAIEIGSAPGRFEEVDAIVAAELDRTFTSMGHDVYRHLGTESYEVTAATPNGVTDITNFRHMEGIEGFATLTEGSWPDSSRGVEAAIHETAAALLDLTVGDEITVTNRRDRSVVRVVRLAGIYGIDDPTHHYWLGDELALDGVSTSSSFRTLGPLAVTEETLLEEVSHIRVDVEWRVLPQYGDLTVPAIPRLRSELVGLEDRLNHGLGEQTGVTGPRAIDFRVTTGIDGLLAATDRSLAVTRAGVIMLSAQLAILAGYALVLTAGLLVETRRTETALVRSRGAGRGQLLTASLTEGILITVPAALAAPWLAGVALEVLNDVGPLASIGLEIEPQVSLQAYLFAFVAAVGCTLGLALPGYRSSKSFNETFVRRGREGSRTLVQRAGLDVAVLMLGALVFWQLRSFGAEISSAGRGLLGVDLLLVAAPAIGLLAGGVLALRTVPLIAWLSEMVVTGGRGSVQALWAWQLARRPQRYARSALLLIMAVGIGLFAASYTVTWERSQVDQADYRVGADLRSLPNRRTNASIPDLHLMSAHRQLEGVEHTMPVVRLTGQLARSTATLVRFVMLDAASAASVVEIREDLDGVGFEGLMSRLAADRPSMETIPLPGRPRAVALTMGVAVESLPDNFPEESEAENRVEPSVAIVVQDADGLLHHVELGPLPVDVPRARVSGALLHETAGGELLTPAYPLSIVDIDITNPTPHNISRTAEIALQGIAVQGEDGAWAHIEVDLDRTAWEASHAVDAPVFQFPSINIAPSQVPNTVTAVIRTGGGGGLPRVPVHFSLRPSGTDLPGTFPIVVTEGFLEATSTSVGDTIRLTSLHAEEDVGLIVGRLDGFPTVEPSSAETVLIDLPTFQMMNYGPGDSIPQPNEHWLAVSGDHREVARALMAAPYDSALVDDRIESAEGLKSDPIALGNVASLSLGFVAAAVFAAVGFTVSATVSARERLTEFALLRALGLSNRQLGTWMSIEQGSLVAISLLFGTFVGMLLSVLVLPLITITQGGAVAVPPLLVVFPVGTIVTLELAVVATLVVIVSILAVVLRRLGLGSLLRIGDE